MGLLDDNLIDVSDDNVNYMMSLGKRYRICININNFSDAANHISIEKLIYILGRECDTSCPVYMNGRKLMSSIPNKIKYISNIVSIIDLLPNILQFKYSPIFLSFMTFK